MTTKYKIIISIVVILTSFAFGRYTAPKTQDTHTVTNTTVDDKKDTTVNDHKKIVIVAVPNGPTTTTITDDSLSQISDTKNTLTKTDTTVTAPKTSTLNLLVLAGTQIHGSSAFQPLYGLSVSKQMLGPITTGLWGLSNGTIGVSVGLNF